MVRKQIYIQEQQERQLRRIAERRGVSQAEVVRNAIEHAAVGTSQSVEPDPSAWQSALAFIRTLHQGSGRKTRRRRWKRVDLYEERLRRHADRSD